MTSKFIAGLIPLNLQLFADGGGVAAGATASVGAAGVNSAGETSSTASNPIEDKATAKPKVIYGKQKNSSGISDTTRKTFEELIKSDDYKDEAKAFMDKAFERRMRKSQETNSKLEAENLKMRAILEMGNTRYGLNPESDTYLDDYAAKMQGDTKLYEEEALEAGMKVEDYMKLKQAEQVLAQNKRDEANRELNEMVNRHIAKLSNEAEALTAEFPNFDMGAEMQNSKFKHLVDPPELGGSGLSVKDAFFAVHHNEIMKTYAQTAVNQATTQVANTIKANKARPTENGLSNSRPTVVKDDPSKLTKADFEEIRELYHRTGERVKF